jgi:hypothetical protein
MNQPPKLSFVNAARLDTLDSTLEREEAPTMEDIMKVFKGKQVLWKSREA